MEEVDPGVLQEDLAQGHHLMQDTEAGEGLMAEVVEGLTAEADTDHPQEAEVPEDPRAAVEASLEEERQGLKAHKDRKDQWVQLVRRALLALPARLEGVIISQHPQCQMDCLSPR